MKLYTETLGTGQDLVFIHGWGFNSQIWSGLAANLAAKFRVTLIDLPGFGLSAPLLLSNTSQLEQFATAVLAIAPKQASYVGWSLGGLVATTVAMKAPHRVCKLINIASNPKFIGNFDWPGMPREVFAEFQQNLTGDCRQTLQRFAHLITRGSNKQRVLLRKITKYLFDQGIPALTTLQTTLHILIDSDLRQALRQLTIPQLHLLGEHDKLIPSTVHLALQNLLPAAQIQLIAGGGHVPFIACQNSVVNAILGFMHA